MVNEIMLGFVFMILQLISFQLNATRYANKIPSGLTFKMIHRDSPYSPMYQNNLTDKERIEKHIEMSKARIRSLVRPYVPRSSSKSLECFKLNNVIIRPILSTQSLLYILEVGIGTFENDSPLGKTYYLGFDTGSDFTWTQCEGCGDHCFHQTDPLFPASRSSTYWPFPQSQCPLNSKWQNNRCELEMSYEDDSKVLAVVAKEVFTFPSVRNRKVGIRLIFGCGFNMQNFGEGKNPNNKISGILGMGNGFYSFMRQTHTIFDGNFSYCLQPMFGTSGRVSPMYLRFGIDVLPQQITGIQTTPIYRYRRRYSYYLNLQGISVDGNRVNIPSDILEIKGDGSAGCVIDSGSTISMIATRAFKAFKDVVGDFIRKNNKNVREMAEPEMGYDICFERYKDPLTLKLPKITFHFEGNADFVMDINESFYIGVTVSRKGMVCSQFVQNSLEENGDITLLGSPQQTNKRIIYDVSKNLLHFALTDCSLEN